MLEVICGVFFWGVIGLAALSLGGFFSDTGY